MIGGLLLMMNGAKMSDLDDSVQNDLPYIDFVLVYDATDLSLATPRKLFESAMEADQLVLERERIGDKLFVKIFCPFERLAIEAERIKLELPLKGCEIKSQNTSYFRSVQKLLTTDDEVDFVSAPFQVAKKQVFVGSENESTLFRTSIRSFLAHHILINLNINDQLKSQCREEVSDLDDNLRKRGLLYLIMKKAYLDSFCIHEPSADEPHYLNVKNKSLEEYYNQIPKLDNDARRELNRTWTKFFKFQPLWKIRNYFGEKIGFYFAWQGTFLTLLWIPSLCGLVIFVYGIQESVGTNSNRFQPCEALSTNSNSTANDNSTSTPNHCDVVMAVKMWSEDLLFVVKRSSDNIFSAFFAMVICLWGSLFLEVWKRNRNTHAYQWDCDTYELAEPDRPEFFGTHKEPDPVTGELEWIFPHWKRVKKFTVSFLVVLTMIGIVFMSVCGVIAYKVAMRVRYNCTVVSEGVTLSQNPRQCFLMVTAIPTFLNAISIMILGRIYDVIARKLTYWENHRTESEFNDALIIKLFAFQFANTYSSLFYIAFFRPAEHGFQDNGVFGWGERYKDTCERGSCMSLLSFQVLVLMLIKPFPKFFKDIILPWFKTRSRRLRERKRRERSHDENDNHSVKYRNFIEHEYFKPKVGDFTLGEYTEKVIQYGYIVMFAGSFPLAPLLALIIGLLDLRIDAKRLLWFNRRPIGFIASDIGMWLPILRFVSFCGVMSNAFIVAYTSSFCADFFTECTTAKRMTIVIVFEHFVLIVMYIISVSIPDMPTAIKLAQRRERYEVPKIMEEGGKRETPADNAADIQSLNLPFTVQNHVQSENVAECAVEHTPFKQLTEKEEDFESIAEVFEPDDSIQTERRRPATTNTLTQITSIAATERNKLPPIERPASNLPNMPV